MIDDGTEFTSLGSRVTPTIRKVYTGPAGAPMWAKPVELASWSCSPE
jgi:hypothetical protein